MTSIAAKRLVDIFFSFFDVLRSQLPVAVSMLTGFIKNPGQGPAKIGVATLEHLIGELGSKLSEEDWRRIFIAIKDATTSTLPGFQRVFKSLDSIEIPETSPSYSRFETLSDQDISGSDLDDENMQGASFVVSSIKNHIAVQLVIIQVYELRWNWNDVEQLTQGAIAGHPLECGCQLTGEYFMHPGDRYRYISFAHLLHLSLPFAKVGYGGQVCVAKAHGIGGLLNQNIDIRDLF